MHIYATILAMVNYLLAIPIFNQILSHLTQTVGKNTHVKMLEIL